MSLCALCLLYRTLGLCIWHVTVMLLDSALWCVYAVPGNSLFKRPISELRVMSKGAVRSNGDVNKSGGYCEQ